MQVIISEVILGETLIPGHAILDAVKHVLLLVKLVVTQVNFLELLGYRYTIQDHLGSLISEVVSSQDNLLKLTLGEDQDLHQGATCCGVQLAVGQRQSCQVDILLDASCQVVQTLRAEVIMVELQNFDWWALWSWRQRPPDELTA